MDPLTATMNAITAALNLATSVWNATPPAMQAASAGDWAKFTHNIGDFFLGIQGKINGLVEPAKTAPASAPAEQKPIT